MSYNSEDLEMGRRHLAQAERHVRVQQDILDHLRRTGRATELAERLLVEFETAVAHHRRKCEQIEVQLTAHA